MPTQTKENYLKAIYYFEQDGQEVTVTALSEKMGVNKSSVNEMMKKLSHLGFIDYEKYKPIELSEQGALQAALIVRKHRLTEMFLTQIMGFGWEEVHSIAEEMEHLKSVVFFNRMDEMLGFPIVDPHGSPIPSKDGEIHGREYVSLSATSVGEEVTLQAVKDTSASLLNMLNEKEIKLGTKFKVRKIESFDKTMVVDYGAYTNVSLSYEVCRRLLVDN